MNAKTQKSAVEFINPPNVIKAKVGAGGLSNDVISRAQQVIEVHTEDFMPLAKTYLDQMLSAIQSAQNKKEDQDVDVLFEGVLLPCVQLKANGAMFHYHIITRVADTFVNFIEKTRMLDSETLEIALAFHSTMHAMIAAKIRENGDPKGEVLLKELEGACVRYLGKHKDELEKQELQRQKEKEAEENAS